MMNAHLHRCFRILVLLCATFAGFSQGGCGDDPNDGDFDAGVDGTVDGAGVDGAGGDGAVVRDGATDGDIAATVAELVLGPDAFDTPFEGISGLIWIYEDPRFVCPDGLEGRFYVVAKNGDTAGKPLVLVLHGGAFDYVDDEGNHLTAQNKLTREWAECKLRDFMGQVAPECADNEANGGAIVAALIEKDAVAVLPANCYGDLWHGTGYTDPADGFARWGLNLALESADFVATEMETAAGERYAWGTSAGGHGIAELIVSGASYVRILADSPADYLPGAQEANPAAYPTLQEGYRRIFEGDADAEHVGRYSLAHAVHEDGFRDPVLYFFSCNDTSLPPEITEPAAQAILAAYAQSDDACVVHAKDPSDPQGPDMAAHVFTNGRLQIARSAADWLLEGMRPPACENTFTPCP
jgi:hypothetical protein